MNLTRHSCLHHVTKLGNFIFFVLAHSSVNTFRKTLRLIPSSYHPFFIQYLTPKFSVVVLFSLFIPFMFHTPITYLLMTSFYFINLNFSNTSIESFE